MFFSDTYIKLSASKTLRGYVGIITCYAKATNKKIWADSTGIARLTEEDAIKDCEVTLSDFEAQGVLVPADWIVK